MNPNPTSVFESGRQRRRLNAALLLSVLALLLIVGQWYNNERHFKGLRKQTEISQTQLMALEKQMEALQGQENGLDARYQEFSQQSDSATVADVEQTLLLANQQLQAVGNIRAALYALEIADERLARAGGTGFEPLRKAFARDMTSLQHVSTLDITDIGPRLDSALGEVDTLPLAMDVQRLPKNSPSVALRGGESIWRQLAATAWREFRSLISVEDRDRTGVDVAVFAPEQVFFLRQNLKLRLLSARVAWLGHDDVDFKADLRAIQEMLNHYFAVKNPAVVRLQALVREFDGRRVDVLVPDLAGSLAALHDYRIVHPQP